MRGYIGAWIVDYVLAFVKNWAGIRTNQVCGMRVYEILNMLRSSKLTHDENPKFWLTLTRNLSVREGLYFY